MPRSSRRSQPRDSDVRDPNELRALVPLARRAYRTAAGFRLLVEPSLSTDSEMLVLSVAPAGCALVFAADGAPRVIDAPAANAALCLELMDREHRQQLAMVVAPGEHVRVNGTPAPPFSPLEIGDVLQRGDTSLHVSWERVPEIAPPPPHLNGVPCALCLTPVDENALIVVHDCGAPLHLSADGEALECALGSCAQCNRAISLEAGLTYHPYPTLRGSAR